MYGILVDPSILKEIESFKLEKDFNLLLLITREVVMLELLFFSNVNPLLTSPLPI